MEGNAHQFAWVDTETSGLEPHKSRVVEIAVVITDSELRDIETYETKIKLSPADFLAASPKALEVNGYNEEEWKDAPESSREIWRRISDMTNKRNFAGQNPLFDTGFVSMELGRWGIKPGWFRRLLDTQAIGQIVMRSELLRRPDGVLTNSLIPVYDALGGPKLPEHRAMGDVRRAIYVYDYFRRLYEDARVAKLTSVLQQQVANGG